MPPILYFFALCNLVIGSGAFVLGGILQPVSTSLGISVAAAGQAMTAYALATAILAPILIVLTSKWPRKRTIQLSLALFTCGCVVCALAPGLGMLLLGRVLMGAGAMFSAAVAALAVSMVPPALRGRALSITFLGMSVSYAVGIPIGAWLGFKYGWRVPVWLFAGTSLAALISVHWLVPGNLASAGTGFLGFRAAAAQPAVLRIWLRTLLYFVAIFSVFAYIGPVLQALNPMSPEKLSATLMIFGLAGMAGTLSGGWASDRFGPIRTLRVQLLALTSMMLLVPLTQGRYPLMVAVFIVWGIAGFGMMSPTQARLVNISPRQAPMLFSLNSSMLYAGTALGAAVGGISSAAFGFSTLAWAGAGFAVLGTFTLVSAKR